MSIPRLPETDQRPKRQRFLGPRVPPNLFAIVLGIAGLAEAWHAADGGWVMPGVAACAI